MARDGRTLTFAEWGDPSGFPVFSLHGTPGSRFGRHYDESVYADAGAKSSPTTGRATESPSGTVVDASSTASMM